MLFVFYAYYCPYRILLESFSFNTKGAISGTGTTYHSEVPQFTSLPFISGFVVAQFFVFLNVISTTVFVHWSFFIWPLNCLSCPSNYGFRLPFWYLKPFWQIGHSVTKIKKIIDDLLL